MNINFFFNLEINEIGLLAKYAFFAIERVHTVDISNIYCTQIDMSGFFIENVDQLSIQNMNFNYIYRVFGPIIEIRSVSEYDISFISFNDTLLFGTKGLLSISKSTGSISQLTSLNNGVTAPSIAVLHFWDSVSSVKDSFIYLSNSSLSAGIISLKTYLTVTDSFFS